MTTATDDRSVHSDSNKEDSWDLAFEEAEQAPSRRRLSDHERWVLTQLLEGTPSK
jgi:hypothetical protein